MGWDKLPLSFMSTLSSTSSWGKLPVNFVNSLLFTTIGLVFFAVSFWVICRVVPFSIRKEIEEDQNSALAIIIGAVILGIAIIVAAAIHGQ